MYQIVTLNEHAAKEICKWRYEGEYAIYNFSSWEEAVEQNWSIADAAQREKEFKGVIDEYGQLIGFFRTSVDEVGEMEIGLGMNPTLCGQGLGKVFVQVITQYVRSQYPNQTIYMEVREFNTRAIKCYESVGYKVIKAHKKETSWGTYRYYRME